MSTHHDTQNIDTSLWPHMQGTGQAPVPVPPRQPEPRRRWPFAVGGLLLGLLIGGAGAATASTTATTQAGAPVSAPTTVTVTAPAPPPETVTVTAPAPAPETVTVQAAPPPAPAPSPAEPATGIGDGVWEVGVDVAPGKYKTTGTNSFSCYYARLKSNDGSLGDIIDNNLSEGPMTVTIKGSDGYFESTGCNDWTKVG
jgi:hypothetical protein